MADGVAHLPLAELAEDLPAHALVHARFILHLIRVAGRERDGLERVQVQEALRHEVGIVRADQPGVDAPGLVISTQTRQCLQRLLQHGLVVPSSLSGRVPYRRVGP